MIGGSFFSKIRKLPTPAVNHGIVIAVKFCRYLKGCNIKGVKMYLFFIMALRLNFTHFLKIPVAFGFSESYPINWTYIKKPIWDIKLSHFVLGQELSLLVFTKVNVKCKEMMVLGNSCTSECTFTVLEKGLLRFIIRALMKIYRLFLRSSEEH